jgi:hypothetical protein
MGSTTAWLNSRDSACVTGPSPRIRRVDDAVARPLVEDPTAGLIMGVDIARQGADQSVIRFRRGLAPARSRP